MGSNPEGATDRVSVAVGIRRCTEADIAVLEGRGTHWRDLDHHRRRFERQQRGEATYLLAWRGPIVAGRVTVLYRSKYPRVVEALPGLFEINALEARPQGTGVGSHLVAAAEDEARRRGARHIGLGVEPANRRARRLYERLGYADWGGGQVIDVWAERDRDGRTTREHRDPCDYLVKPLR